MTFYTRSAFVLPYVIQFVCHEVGIQYIRKHHIIFIDILFRKYIKTKRLCVCVAHLSKDAQMGNNQKIICCKCAEREISFCFCLKYFGCSTGRLGAYICVNKMQEENRALFCGNAMLFSKYATPQHFFNPWTPNFLFFFRYFPFFSLFSCFSQFFLWFFTLFSLVFSIFPIFSLCFLSIFPLFSLACITRHIPDLFEDMGVPGATRSTASRNFGDKVTEKNIHFFV